MNLNIAGEEFDLKCTLEAFRTIPATLGGFVGTFNNLAQADPETCSFIIAAATGKGRDMKERERIAGLLFKAGLSAEVIGTLTEYVQMLSNGGKVPSKGSDGSGE